MTLSNREPRSWRPSGAGLAVGGVAGLLARDLDLRSLISYYGDVHVMVVALAVLTSLLWHSRLRVPIAAGAALLAAVWLAAIFTPLSAHLAGGLVRQDAIRPADAVFVLASRIQNDGDMTGVALNRLVRGLELLGRNEAPRLILSELPPPYRPYAVPAQELMDRLNLKTELLTVGPVNTTRDEAVAVAALCRARGWRRILLVTSPTHSRRASAAFEHEGVEVISAPAREIRYDLELLDLPGERLQAFGGILHERLGLWVYTRRGWI